MSLRLTLAALAVLLSAACGPGALSPATSQASATAPAPRPIPAAPAQVQLAAPDGRRIDVSVWEAPDERGVVVFSHGYNGSPAAYERLLARWVEHGFTVVAPLHVDSRRHPDHARHDGPSAFSTRVADLAVTRGFVKTTRPGKAIVAAGHSFGSLMSYIQAGALTVAGPQGDPDIKAVIALSSAGDLPGVVLPGAYAGLDLPLLSITGDMDLVPGFVSDWRAHRSAFDASPRGDKTLIIFEGGDHSLVRTADEQDFDLVVRATRDFLSAHALGDPGARTRLNRLDAPSGVIIERR
ncbi:MAG TPA: alpha/beta hydrolase [Brevundimonas sp.]|nr:alpha/beta hydrolase [Brevundimonas sp.]